MAQPPTKKAPRLFLIDAYALIYRSYFAFISNPLISSKGENTSAPFGFVRFLISLREDFDPDYLAVVFDSGRSDREKLYPAYKATREKMPDDLRASLPRVRALVDAFHDPVVEVDGYEADDVIGTLATEAETEGLEVVIVSGDKDFYQLVSPRVSLLNPGRGGAAGVEAHWVDRARAIEKLGVPPEQVVDYLALIGDSSDNVPGAPGIGPKTAVKLLDQYSTVESVLEHAGDIKGKRARESLLENGDDVRLSKELVTIRKDVPIELDLDALRVQEPDRDRLRELFAELEFRKLIEDFTGTAGAGSSAREVDLDHRVVTDAGELPGLVAAWQDSGTVSIAAIGSTSDPHEARLVGLAIASGAGVSRYLPLGHEKAPALALGDLSEPDLPNLLSLGSPEMAGVRELLGDPDVAKVGHDLKYAALLLDRAGAPLYGASFDTMVASYVLNPGRRAHDLPALAGDLLSVSVPTRKEVVGSGRSAVPMVEIQVDRGGDLANRSADAGFRLYERFDAELKAQDLFELFETIEMPLLPVLVEMERAGIAIDPEFFASMSARLEKELGHIEREIHAITGRTLNLNSTPQLREVLFGDLGLPVLKRTKTGPSTDASVLEELAAMGHDVPRLLIEYRQLEKLRSTYVDALPRLVNRRTGRIHTSFNQAVAATGRLSSSDPNLQNIPIRTDLGREVRRGFVAGEGHLFYAADYSQVELRILAHLSGDPAFVTAFTEGVDVHKQTASVIFDVGIEDVTAEMRAQAKTINFATLYGQGDFSLARSLGIPRAEAKAFIENYFERFSGVRTFLDEQVAMARDRGYVETLSGRRRYVPELQSKNWNIRQFGERVAQNTPIQGTAADLIKLAMIRVQRALDESGSGARLLLQVHDELLFEVPAPEVDTLRPVVVEAMENAMALSVPLVVDDGVGPNWYECKG
jgi:DNA polymerase-1